MTNILLNSFRIAQTWCYDNLMPFIQPSSKIVVFPLAFREQEISNISNWLKRYDKASGYMAKGFAQEFAVFGVKLENITWVNLFDYDTEDIRNKIAESDIIYFSGGVPHLIIPRLEQMNVIDEVKNYGGIVIGDSAGALIQLDTYHITPDADYPEYKYYNGLGMLSGFDVEVHYTGTDIQKQSVMRCILERKIPVYTMGEQGGVIVRNGQIVPFGDVKCEV